MRIPPRADKWIVFGVFTVVGAIDVLGSREITYDRFEWTFVCFGTGAVFAILYVLWSAAWRWTTRRHGPNPPRPHLRLITNTTFCLLAIAIIWMPIPASTVRIDLPKKVEIHR